MKRMNKTLASLILSALLAIAPGMIVAASADSVASAADVNAVKITFSEALSIVSDAYPDLKLFALSLDSENGVLLYQAELFNPGGTAPVTVGIDSASGELLPQSADTDTREQTETESEQGENESSAENEQNENETGDTAETGDEDPALLQSAALSVAQAQEQVMAMYPGASVTAIELQNENNGPVYGVSLIDANGQAQTLKIDAVSGALLPEDAQSEVN